MVNIKEVAKLANTSITTVSRVINNTGYVKQETKERVLESIKELGYRPLERSVMSKDTKIIGLIVPDIENPFFGKIARYISKIANKFNYNILLFNFEAAENKKDIYLMDLIENRVDGLIYASSHRCKYVINAAKSKNIPIVVLDREIKNGEINSVAINNNYGAFIATEHLIKQGNKHIAYIGGAVDMEISNKRKEGYIRAMKENNMSINENYISYGNYKMQSGFECMEKLFKDNPEITAVLAANDLMAIGALNYLHKHGINVPKDISVVGFDNIELSSNMVPSLSTVEYPIERLSEIVFDLIIGQIKDKDKNIELVTLLPKLIERESSSYERE